MKAANVMNKETFAQAFRYDETRIPCGCSLEEYMRGCLFVESAPTQFSFSCAGRRDMSPQQQFQRYRSFAEKHRDRRPIQDCLFPLFCKVVMALKQARNGDELDVFAISNLPFIPEASREEANAFVRDDKVYRTLACQFETQLYIIKTNDSSADILRSFINDPENSGLRMTLVETITLDIEREEVRDRQINVRFTPPSDTASLSIVQCRVENVTSAVTARDFSGIYATVGDQCVFRVDSDSKKSEQLYSHASRVTTMSLSCESKVLVTGDIEGVVSVWSEEARETIPSVHSSIWCSKFAPQGGVFALGMGNAMIGIYDAPMRRQHRRLVGHDSPVTVVDFHPNCSLVGSLAVDPAVRVWDLREAGTVRLFIGKQNRNSALVFSGNGKYVAYFDGDLCICDIGRGETVLRKSIQLSEVVALAFSVDSHFLYAVGPNSEVITCSVDDGEFRIHELFVPSGRVVSAEMTQTNELRIVTTHSICK